MSVERIAAVRHVRIQVGCSCLYQAIGARAVDFDDEYFGFLRFAGDGGRRFVNDPRRCEKRKEYYRKPPSIGPSFPYEFDRVFAGFHALMI